jgi:hypothetical protein
MNSPNDELHRRLSELLLERHQALLRHDADAFFSASRHILRVRQELQASFAMPQEGAAEHDPALG